jgi:hypothetical protein
MPANTNFNAIKLTARPRRSWPRPAAAALAEQVGDPAAGNPEAIERKNCRLNGCSNVR